VVPAAQLIARLTADRRPREERELDFSPWGGAYNRVSADATAFPCRDARFLLKQTATVAAGERPGGLAGRVIRAHPPVRHWRRLPPEPGPSDQAYHLGNTGRLRRIRGVYYPQAVFAAS